MKSEKFEKLVEKALLELPKPIQKKMENIAVCIEESPKNLKLKKSGSRILNFLLGLYQGVPRTVWGRDRALARLPDKITIFKQSIEKLAGPDEKRIAELVRIVVWHEVAHHFGFSEKEVRALEKKWRKKLLEIK